jgi:hypothetical protein
MRNSDKVMGGWLRKTLLDPALWITLPVAFCISFLGSEEVLRAARVDVGLAQVGIGTALLGIVLAGLSVLVAFLNEEYVQLLEKVGQGFDADLWPFKWTALIAILCAAFGMGLLLIGDHLTPVVFRLILALSLWSFSYLLWILYHLVEFIAGHAKARAVQLDKKKKS